MRDDDAAVNRELVPPLFAAYAAKALSGRAKFLPTATAVIEQAFLVSPFAWRGLILRVSRLRTRPKGAALWNPAAFEKAGEAFALRYALSYFGAQLSA